MTISLRKGYSAEFNCWVPAENLAEATDALAKFYSTQLKPRKEKGPKALPLPVPRATGIPQLQRNIVVQIDLGTSRSAVDALLPVFLPPESDSGLREAKQSNSTPDSRLQVGAHTYVSPTSRSSLSHLPVCVPSCMESVRTDTRPRELVSESKREKKRETEAERTLEKSKENRVTEPRAKQKESRSLEGKVKELEKGESGTGRGIVEKSESKRAAGSEPFEIDFMDICRIDTLLVKRIPNSQRSAYATVWGQLLKQALDDKKCSSWVDFNVSQAHTVHYVERSSRLSKKAKFADVVRNRLAQWKKGEKGELERSKRAPIVAAPRKANKLDIKVLEAAVLAALRMADVRKALKC